jgi:hypothetical protein
VDLITDVARGDWLLARVGTFVRVGGTVGTGFEAYARILHPVPAVLEDTSVTDRWGQHPVLERVSWRWADVAARVGGTVHPLVQWTRLTGTEDETDVVFDDGWRASPPEDGWFEPAQLAALAEPLAAATTTPDDLVAAVWEGWGDLNGSSSLGTAWSGADDLSASDEAELRGRADSHAAEYRRQQAELVASIAGPRLEWPHRTYFLLSTTISQLADRSWFDDPRLGTFLEVGHTPQLLWPEDRAWAVATEIDWDSTIVAGSRALIDAVLADARFEAFEVDEDSDLTWDGDTVNRRR